jgi:hypothetical protein
MPVAPGNAGRQPTLNLFDLFKALAPLDDIQGMSDDDRIRAIKSLWPDANVTFPPRFDHKVVQAVDAVISRVSARLAALPTNKDRRDRVMEILEGNDRLAELGSDAVELYLLSLYPNGPFVSVPRPVRPVRSAPVASPADADVTGFVPVAPRPIPASGPGRPKGQGGRTRPRPEPAPVAPVAASAVAVSTLTLSPEQQAVAAAITWLTENWGKASVPALKEHIHATVPGFDSAEDPRLEEICVQAITVVQEEKERGAQA